MTNETRRMAGWVIVVLEGLYTFTILGLSTLAFGYLSPPTANSGLVLFRYTLPLLLFPCFLISLIRWRWATLPLWLISVTILVWPFILSLPNQKMLGYAGSQTSLKEIALVFVVPIGMELGLWLKRPDSASALSPTTKPYSPRS